MLASRRPPVTSAPAASANAGAVDRDQAPCCTLSGALLVAFHPGARRRLALCGSRQRPGGHGSDGERQGQHPGNLPSRLPLPAHVTDVMRTAPAASSLKRRDGWQTHSQEAALMTLVGCDLHSRKQQVAVLDTTTGEVLEEELSHDGDAVERFYRALRPPVTIGIETTGYTPWFHALMHRLGHTVLVGEAGRIRAMVVRKTKTDRRDARHLLDLLKHDRFPTVWMPDPDTRDLRALVAHRVRLVRMRTMVKN